MKKIGVFIIILYYGFVNAQESSHLWAMQNQKVLDQTTFQKSTNHLQLIKPKRDKGDVYAGIYYLMGMNIPTRSVSWTSLQYFIEDYNKTYQAQLIQPLNIDYKSSFAHGAEFFIQALTMNVLWSKLNGQGIAKFQNGDERVIDLKLRNFSFGWDLVIPIKKVVGIGGVMSLNQFKGEMMSGYKYHQNGYVSYAQDKPYNGIYSLRSKFAMGFGGRINLNFKFVTLVLRAQNILNKKPSQTDKLSPLYDKLSSTATGGSDYTDGNIPQNFSFAPDPNTGEKNLINQPHGWFFSVFLGIGITNLHD